LQAMGRLRRILSRFAPRGTRPPEAKRIVIVVGLGNPGAEYAGTRHNIGYEVANAVARRLGVEFGMNRCYSRIAQATRGEVFVSIARPTAFMNRSGWAVRSLLRRYQARPEDLLVICDDTNLPLGKIRLRSSGGPGGHNGLKSIILYAKSKDFPRLRVGVSAAPDSSELTGHVLGRFAAEERRVANEAVRQAADAAIKVIDNGIEAAMNEFN
jgi:PTH1 family peptidyl-tRNA hydrolase